MVTGAAANVDGDRRAVDAASGGPFDEVDRLRRAAAGHADDADWLVGTIGPVVYGYVYARVGGNEAHAADLLQETLLEVVRSAASFRGDASLATWSCAIANRRLARHYERERRAEVADRHLTVVAGGRDDEPIERATPLLDLERRDELVRALGTLPASQRHALVRKYLDDRSVAEIATELGRSPVQVQSLLQRGRAALRHALEAATDD